jgi:hypothetical protein
MATLDCKLVITTANANQRGGRGEKTAAINLSQVWQGKAKGFFSLIWIPRTEHFQVFLTHQDILSRERFIVLLNLFAA